MGGTGKTPVVAAVGKLLAGAGRRVAVLSRGYGRSGDSPTLVSKGDGLEVPARQAGDEPAWYAQALPDTIVAVARRREAAAALASELHPDLYLLDDAFQHVRVARDVDLLVVDADQPFYHSSPPPSGRLREMPSAAARASAFVLHGSPHAAQNATAALQRRFPNRPIFVFHRGFPGVVGLDVFLRDAAVATASAIPPETRLLAFAGIARPRRLFESLEGAARVVATREFADHHWYRASDLEALVGVARADGAEALITTEKDAVRMAALTRPDFPVWVWRYRLEPKDPAALAGWLGARLDAVAGNGAA